MSKTIKCLALNRIVLSDAAGGEIVKTPKDAPFPLSQIQFDELSERGAVRKARKGDFNGADPATFDHDGDGDPGGSSPQMKPHHRGGGKWDVVNSADDVVSGDEMFDSKDDAQAWIDLRPNGAEDLLG